jgi:hypothetical protein
LGNEFVRFFRIEKKPTFSLAHKLAIPLVLRPHQQFHSLPSPVVVGQSVRIITNQYDKKILFVDFGSILEYGNM